MDILILAILITTGVYLLNGKAQRRRIALLGSHLGQFQIEKLMEALIDGYLRAMGEKTDERRDQIWSLLSTTESQLSEQLAQLATDFARIDADQARVSRLPIALPFAEQIFPNATFDMRRALAIHARGVDHVAQNTGHLNPKERAFMMTAELLLLQHTCHWFCKSRTIATARMLARHQTPHEQLVESVSAETRNAYLALINGN